VLIACLAGLALLTSGLAYAVNGPPAGALPGSGTPTAQAANVTVTLREYTIASSQTSFMPGVHYHFTVVNKGAISHELMLLPRVLGQGMGSSMSMDQLDHMALARTGDLTPGATKTIDYTFTSAMAGQHMELGCYYPGHYESGMHLPIAVST
jgi:uncharacterized cupredoxin-like copper-binding protein